MEIIYLKSVILAGCVLNFLLGAWQCIHEADDTIQLTLGDAGAIRRAFVSELEKAAVEVTGDVFLDIN